MSPLKTKKSTQFFQCDGCNVIIPNKDTEQHNKDCPPSVPNITYNFVKENCLYGILSIKATEDVQTSKNIDQDFMVFLSQAVIQLCNLSIGDWAVITDLNKAIPKIAKIVWPTTEKSLTTVSVTKRGVAAYGNLELLPVMLSKAPDVLESARRMVITYLSNKKVPVCKELISRIHNYHLDKLLMVGNKINIIFYGKCLQFQIKYIEGFRDHQTASASTLEDDFKQLSINEKAGEFYKIVDNTVWEIFSSEKEYMKQSSKNLLASIGGLNTEIAEIQNLMNIALGKLNFISGLQISRGVLLYGASGNGKTLTANALAKSSNAHIVNINIIEIYSQSDNSPEENIRTLYEDALSHSPSVIIIDDIDFLCPNKSIKLNDTEKRISANLIKIFDDLYEKQYENIFIIATTSRLDSVDTSLRRCGRLDKEIEIPTPNPKARLDILKKILKDTEISFEGDALQEIANSAHGFVGSDLEALCTTAALHAVKREDSKILYEDLIFALTRTIPSAMKEVQIEAPNVKWTDIGGQEDLKLILRQAIEWPLTHMESFTRMGITPPKGVLMFGPPGCSKTMIAKALATESNLNFLSIKGPELFSKWVGESERAVRQVFKKARQVAPSIIFFDEIDAIGGERSSGSSTSVQERVLAQLLTELDGVTPLGDVTVLAATNRPDRIDRALLRPGRLDRIVYVPLPNEVTRREIFKLKLSKMPVINIDIEDLVNRTEGYSGAEVNLVCHEAAMKALEEDINSKMVEMRHFAEALKIVKRRTPESLLKIYEAFLNNG